MAIGVRLLVATRSTRWRRGPGFVAFLRVARARRRVVFLAGSGRASTRRAVVARMRVVLARRAAPAVAVVTSRAPVSARRAAVVVVLARGSWRVAAATVRARRARPVAVTEGALVLGLKTVNDGRGRQ